ncbi:hypothetical protein RB195_024187 [Necator americanus]|uniref:Uncharacterized protein n=1 Tax=Necator americanus TaxID=51031 RepID=A0ABR1EM47_NECAM
MRLRRKLCPYPKRDSKNEWTSRAGSMKGNKRTRTRKKHMLYREAMFGSSQHCQRSVGQAALPMWREHFNTLLEQQAPPLPELEHVQRPRYTAVSERPPTLSKVLASIQKMKN